MSFRDSMDHVASASEMSTRVEREASLFNEYDDPSEIPASVIYAPRSIGTTTPSNPLLMERLAAVPSDVAYGEVPNVIALPAQRTRGAA